jgi:hypothetical protein
VSYDHDIGGAEHAVERRDELLLCRSIHLRKLFRLAVSLRNRRGCDLPPANGETAFTCPAPVTASAAADVPRFEPVASAPTDGPEIGLDPSMQEIKRGAGAIRTCSLGQDLPFRLPETAAALKIEAFPAPSRRIPQDVQKDRCPNRQDFRRTRKGAPTNRAGTPSRYV